MTTDRNRVISEINLAAIVANLVNRSTLSQAYVIARTYHRFRLLTLPMGSFGAKRRAANPQGGAKVVSIDRLIALSSLAIK